MNNKRLGMEFENEVCEFFKARGYWVHFIEPKPDGSQPFDIIAVKDGYPLAIDCKTSSRKVFPFTRLEENQINSFEKWMSVGNPEPRVVVAYKDRMYFVPYIYLKRNQKVDLTNSYGILSWQRDKS